MKRRLLSLIVSLFLLGTVSAQHYTVNPHAYDNNMPIVAVIHIDNAVPTTGTFEIGAFIGDEVRGSALIQSDLDNTYWMQVYYNTETESTATISFKVYDGTEVMDVDNTLAVNPEGAGTKADPIELDITTATTVTTPMFAGWSWWSTPIELGENGLELLENSLGENGLLIKAGNGLYVDYIPEWGWWGDEELTINNEYSYEIRTSAATQLGISGRIANPSDHPITISKGWNWIGYPVNEEIDVNEAFASITPTDNDIIQNKDGYSEYVTGWGFWGDVEVMLPGIGYRYKANGNGSQTLVYPSGNNRSKTNQFFVTNQLRPESVEHRYVMNVIAVVDINGQEIASDNFEIQALSNGQICGRASLRYCDPKDRYSALLSIYGDENEQVQFVLNDTNNGQFYPVKEGLTFESEKVMGTLSSPYTIHAGSSAGFEYCFKSIFPNPANTGSEVRLELFNGNECEPQLIEVFNGLGERVYANSCSDLTISFRAPETSGVYVVRLTMRNGESYFGNLIVTK